MSLALYRLAGALGDPAIRWALERRVARGKEDADRIGERLGIATRSRPLIVFHCTSPAVAILGGNSPAAKAASGRVLSPKRPKGRPEMSEMLVYMTAGSLEEARRIGRALVEERLAAGVNLLPVIRSIYRWQGQVEEAEEVAMIAKTQAILVDRLTLRVAMLHTSSGISTSRRQANPMVCPTLLAGGREAEQKVAGNRRALEIWRTGRYEIIRTYDERDPRSDPNSDECFIFSRCPIRARHWRCITSRPRGASRRPIRRRCNSPRTCRTRTGIPPPARWSLPGIIQRPGWCMASI